MSKDHLEALLSRYREDAEFAAQIDAAASSDAVMAVAAEHGLEVDAADLATAANELHLSDAELENVAGGYSCSPMCAPARDGGAVGSFGVGDSC
jgi:predicted ribosomally synthesized peptide with nif11-like leader